MLLVIFFQELIQEIGWNDLLIWYKFRQASPFYSITEEEIPETGWIDAGF